MTECVGEVAHHFPFVLARLRAHCWAHPIDATLGIGERAVLFQKRRARQEDVCQLGGLVDEEVLHDHALHGAKRSLHMQRVGVGLGNVFALHKDALECAVDCAVQHVGDAKSWLGLNGGAPQLLEHLARGIVTHVAVPRQLVREGAHVACSLHVVLPAQRVDTHAIAAQIASGHCQVGHAHHHG